MVYRFTAITYGLPMWYTITFRSRYTWYTLVTHEKPQHKSRREHL